MSCKSRMVSLGLCLLLLAIGSPVHSQPQSGFITIDCGLPGGENASYIDANNQIYYSSDDQYIDTGINRVVDLEIANLLPIRLPWFRNLRSFPYGTRNCYTLSPTTIGKKYLIRAGFYYGNYDGLNSPPEFDVYVGTDRWKSLRSPDATNGTRIEIITMASMDFISVCLVKTGNLAPFISLLELRPLDDAMYSYVNDSQSLVLAERFDVGLDPLLGRYVRYPYDMYDRLWRGAYLGDVCSYNADLPMVNSSFRLPMIVMSTACMPVGNSLMFQLLTDNSSEYLFFFHFAEVEILMNNESREFSISLNGNPFGHPVVLNFPQAVTVYTDQPLTGLQNYTFTIDKLESSTHPPLLNALEIYTVKRVSELTTYMLDVNAIMDIKAKYQVKRNWMGDPCLPRNSSWDGLECSYNDSNHLRIISLNLSSTGLTGNITSSIANLTSLQSLDLSNNNLTGSVPDFLAELRLLRFLNLSGNQLEGTVPQALLEKSKDGSLSLRYDRNPYLSASGSRENKRNKRILLAIIIPVVLAVVILLLIAINIGWRRRRAAKPIVMSYPSYGASHQKLAKDYPTSSETQYFSSYQSWYFKYSDIVRMTNNFGRVIGVGVFGKAYYGCMTNGTPVAVKVLPKSSPQGSKNFKIEAQLLMGICHRNLVSLIGFSDEGKEIALIYEYMAEGNLKQHLSGTTSRAKSFDWGQ